MNAGISSSISLKYEVSPNTRLLNKSVFFIVFSSVFIKYLRNSSSVSGIDLYVSIVISCGLTSILLSFKVLISILINSSSDIWFFSFKLTPLYFSVSSSYLDPNPKGFFVIIKDVVVGLYLI